MFFNTLFLAGVALASFGAGVIAEDCKCGPGDKCWPSQEKWDKLNKKVDGRLIRTVPIGHVCHEPTYDAAACANLQKNWLQAETHDVDPTSIMQSYWANSSCSPFDPPSKPCIIGDYVQYTINVTTQDHIKAGIKFAKKHNIRLVIKNTGHDQTGRSTGYGALGLWTHFLKGPELIPDYEIDGDDKYNYKGYRGPAVKLMAGDQVDEVLNYLQPKGFIAVGGTCPSVGIAGGYTPGGGHSTLSSLYGLGADQTLEFEVITAKGDVVKATPTKNQDLYWALSGGGPSTYGIVWSITVRVHQDFPVGTAQVTMPIGNHTEDEYWQIIDTWHSIVPSLNTAAAYAYAFYYQGYFQIWPLIAHNMTVAQADALLKPLVNKMDELRFQYNYSSKAYPNYNAAYSGAFAPWTVGGIQLGSRLIPRDVVANQSKALSSTIRNVFDDGALVIEAIMAPSLAAAGNPDNAVLPAWRPSVIDLIVGAAWNDSAPKSFDDAQQAKITNDWMPQLKKLAPDSGSYMNEGDPNDPDWKVSFFGEKYPRLLEIKQRWDPDGLFYALKTVGSDVWRENDKQVLCKVEKGKTAYQHRREPDSGYRYRFAV